MTTTTRISSFLAKFTPKVAAQLRAARRKLRAQIPRGYELVFDNYNALVFGFSPTEKSSESVISLAVYPGWVTLFFLWGTKLTDPQHLLEGSGKQVRSIRLSSPDDLDTAPVRALIRQAVGAAPFAKAPKLSTVIKSVSAVQRPRRNVVKQGQPRGGAGRRGGPLGGGLARYASGLPSMKRVMDRQWNSLSLLWLTTRSTRWSSG
jgi:hypothetical protein